MSGLFISYLGESTRNFGYGLKILKWVLSYYSHILWVIWICLTCEYSLEDGSCTFLMRFPSKEHENYILKQMSVFSCFFYMFTILNVFTVLISYVSIFKQVRWQLRILLSLNIGISSQVRGHNICFSLLL